MGMAVETGKPGKGPKPSINVTPLVDVVLVLLIIFMLIIPNMQDDKPIELIKRHVPGQGRRQQGRAARRHHRPQRGLTLEEQDMAPRAGDRAC